MPNTIGLENNIGIKRFYFSRHRMQQKTKKQKEKTFKKMATWIKMAAMEKSMFWFVALNIIPKL